MSIKERAAYAAARHEIHARREIRQRDMFYDTMMLLRVEDSARLLELVATQRAQREREPLRHAAMSA